MDNPYLLMVLLLALAVMGGYYYLRRAQSRGHDVPGHDDTDVR
jgi:hypothetical protein